MKINTKTLSGEDLLYYYTHDHPDKDYASVVALLEYATGDHQKAIEIIVECEKTGKRLWAVYPGDGTNISKLTYVGDIIDGALYYG